MTDLVTLSLPAAWLNGATSCALYVFSGVAFDIIQFDMVAGQPVLRYPPAAPETVPPPGDSHAHHQP